MSESAIVKVLGDGTLKFKDSGGSNSYTVDYEAGDLQITVGGRAVNVFLNRGHFGASPSIRYGDDQECTFTFTAQLRDAGADTGAATLQDVLQWLVGSSATSYVNTNWVPIGGASAEVNTAQLEWTVEGSDHGDGADHIWTLSPCVCTHAIAEGNPSTITITGRAFVPYPTVA